MNNITKSNEPQKGFSIIGLAFKNVFSYTWMNLKICLTFACLTFLITLFTIYNFALNEKEQEVQNQMMSCYYAYHINTSNKTVKAAVEKYFGDCEKHEVCSYPIAEKISSIKQINIANSSSKYLILTYNGEDLTSNGNAIAAIYTANVITEDDYLEFKERFKKEEIVIGRLPSTNEEMVLSEPLINDFGLQKEDVLNKQITITIDGEDKSLLTATVTGVISKEYFELTGHIDTFRPGIIVSDDNQLFKEKKTIFSVYMLKELITDADVIDELTNMGISYSGKYAYRMQKNVKNVRILANNLYVIIGSGLIVGLVLMIFMMVGKYVKIFSRSSGILLTFGLERKKLYLLLFLQLMIISLFAVPFAIAMTFSGYYIINYLMLKLLYTSLVVSIKRLFGMSFISVIVVLAISVIFLVYTILKMRKNTIKELLNTLVS